MDKQKYTHVVQSPSDSLDAGHTAFNVTQKETSQRETKDNKTIIYLLCVVIMILLIATIVLIVYVVADKNNNNIGDTEMTTVAVDEIEGLDNYLKAHCVLHLDTNEAEGMYRNGKNVTVIRNPVDIPSPINVAYTPLLNNVTGEIEYFTNLDRNGNKVAKPLCQTDFDTSTYTMKGNGYVFDKECEFPLPSWMDEADILDLPRRDEPITHRVVITTVEVIAEIEPGHTFEFQTYNGTVPGPPLRVRVGDWIDLTLVNPNTSLHEHSIDFHAMSGPGGGAVSLRVNPGEQARTIWQAIIPGMFIYHCASGWVSDHISKGMYGAIIVEAADGLPYSDMDIFLGQSELYLRYPLVNNWGTNFAIPRPNLHNRFDPIKERYEMSDVVMMNGAPFALVHNPIVTTVGSVVRAFVVAGGPNILSSFHMIGDHFDRVWLHGDFHTSPQQNIQTTTVPPGGCSVADWRHDSPGNYIFVDHALTRSFVRGNLGIIRACNRDDGGCITGSSGKSVANKYNCNPDRYNESDPVIDVLRGNDDCVFCPWNRHDFVTGTDEINETSRIYDYLDEQCNNNGFDSRNVTWQGVQSRHDETMSNVTNKWRRNRYPAAEQWRLPEYLRNVDPMVGNPRNTTVEDVADGVFDASPCLMKVSDLISIYYVMSRSGDGEISITTPRNNLLNGGYISFGRGGNGISAMQDSHFVSALFKEEDDYEVAYHFSMDYEAPSLDTSNLKFPASNPSLTFLSDEITFNFNTLSGFWIKPSSSLTTIPMIIAIGEIGDSVESGQMVKHFEKAIVHLNLIGNQCLLGGEIK
eukprot:74441_1